MELSTERPKHEVEVLPRQMAEACKSLRRSHCEIVSTQDGKAGTKRITYLLPEGWIGIPRKEG